MTQVRQFSFASGELAPSLYGRVDQGRYASGLRKCRNFIVNKSGGISNRSGTRFLAVAKQEDNLRLIPFIFSTADAYVLEFGNLYIRFYRNSALITDTAKVIVSATQANPVLVTSTAHGYTTGDRVIISGVAGMTQLNNREFSVTVMSANTFQLSGIDGTAYGAYTSGGTANRIIEIATPYLGTDLAALKYAQSNDVMTLVHPSYAPRQLSRSAHTSWTLSTISFNPSAGVVPGLSAVFASGSHTASTYFYQATGISRTTGEESLAGIYNSVNTVTGATQANPVVITTASARAYYNNDEVTFLSVGGMTQLNEKKFIITVTETNKVIVGITQANPAVVTSTGHGYANGNTITISGVVGMTQVNGLTFTVAGVTANTFELSGINSTAYTAYTSGGVAYRHTNTFSLGVDGTGYSAFTAGGSVYRTYLRVNHANAPTIDVPIYISLVHNDAFSLYNIYRASQNGQYGLVGTMSTPPFSSSISYGGSTLTFLDTGSTPDTTISPPIETELFEDADGFPSCVTYYQQRQLFGGTNSKPATIYPSQVGHFTNFTTHPPGARQDDDAFNFTLVGRRLNKVVDMVDVGKLIAFTSDGEWAVNGGDAGQLTPTDINARQHTYNGSSILSPMVANGSVLYVQERGAIVRDLLFDFQVDGYTGSDLTTFSSHLFQGFELVDSAYQKTPHSVAWYVRDDGILLGCTYNREHQIIGWVHCDFSREADTTAEVRNVCVIPEGDEDVLYVAVNRSLGTYIERFETRQINDVTLGEFVTASGDVNDTATFMDSYLAYDGRNATLSKTATLSGGTNWDENETLTLTMSAALFTTGTVDVGREVRVEDSTGVTVRCSIESVGSTTVATVRPNRTVPVGIRTVATNLWAFAAKSLTGLWHLNGEEVSIVGNGYVVANPNDDNYDVITATLGSVTLPENYTVIQVGLPFVSDLETLDIDTVQGETLMGKKKLISEVTIFTDKSRGIWVGEELPETDDSHEGLFRPRSRDQGSGPDTVPAYFDAPQSVNITATWNLGGRVVVRQTDPLPISILAISPTGYIPLRGGA